MSSKKILFLAIHRPNRSPSQRYRIECYADYWRQEGYELFQRYIIDSNDDRVLYAQGNLLPKSWVLLKTVVKRLAHVLTAHRYDFIIIQREAFLLGTTLFEHLTRYCSSAKIIFDFDDAIWLPNVSEGNKRWAFLKNPGKTASLIKMADAVVAGNRYLAEYALPFNAKTILIPSAIDLRLYPARQQPTHVATDAVCIGWSGSSTTVQHFETALPALQIIHQKYGPKVRFALIGDASYQHPDLPVSATNWQPETEASDIAGFDIGIMPLPHNEWVKGKCAMKGLQYMAAGVPAVLERVGANMDVITDGHNGLLAGTTEEWVEKLSLLIEHPDVRLRLGSTGRQTVEQSYSVQVLYKHWLDLFGELLQL